MITARAGINSLWHNHAREVWEKEEEIITVLLTLGARVLGDGDDGGASVKWGSFDVRIEKV